MSYQEIRYELVDRIATITLNRPDRLNAWTPRMGDEARDAMRGAADDDAVRVIVLTGAGRGFCAGADMATLSRLTEGRGSSAAAQAPSPFDPSSRRDFQKRYSYFPAVGKPIIAAVNGPCAGLGLVLALYCDMRFAAPKAQFTTAFSRRGLIAEHGISRTLPSLIGLSGALDLLLSARRVGAEEALPAARRPRDAAGRTDGSRPRVCVRARRSGFPALDARDQTSAVGGPLPDPGGSDRERRSGDGGEL
jgi:enoyl-CoA hydratase/carnithine racemase